MGAMTPGGAKTARLVFLVHSWVGLKFFLVLTLVLATGTLAVLRDEIDWLVYPQMRIAPGPERVGFEAMLKAVREAQPGAGILGEIHLHGRSASSAVTVITVSPADGVRRTFIDPYRGVVTGTTPLLTPGYFLSQLHAYLLIPTWGYVIVCSFAFFMVTSLVTGLVTYRKFWRGFLRRPRTRDARTLLGDLHRLGAVWSIWFLIVMSLTSLWYFWIFVGEPRLGFPHVVGHRAPPHLSAEALDRLGPAPPARLDLDALAARVRAEVTDFDIRHVTLPAVHEAPVTFAGNRGEPLAANLTEIHVDPFSGAIVGHEPFRPLSGKYVDALVDALHFGDFAGLGSKLIWFVFGLILTGLSATGFLINWHRVRRRRGAQSQAYTLASALVPWGGGMGLLKPVNLAVLVMSAYACVMAVRFYGGGTAAFPSRYAPQAVGPWVLGATMIAGIGDVSDPIRPGRRAIVLVDYCPDCWTAIRRLWVNVGANPAGPAGLTRVVGQPGYAAATLTLPAEIDAATRLWLTAEAWDGRRYQASWQLRTN